MRDVIAEVEKWRAQGKEVAVATVVRVWGSAPRPPGSKLVISSAGEMAGSVSGGCVEGAVFQEAQEVLASGRAKRLTFGVSNEDAWAVGLSCGGEIQILVELLEEIPYLTLKGALDKDQLVAEATVLTGPGLGRKAFLWPDGLRIGELGSSALDSLFPEAATRCFGTFGAEVATMEEGAAPATSPAEIFVQAHAPRPQLIVVGAVHTAIPLVSFAKTLGFHTVVVDPRETFASPERFPHADLLLAQWPQEAFSGLSFNEATYLAVLSHDPKIDQPALEGVLRQPLRYIGALGSKKTHKKRVAALKDAGFSEQEIGRIHAPIGLHLGGRRPEEIAVAIIAQMIAASHGVA